jgi:HAD superfamily hydrolase (TIGR01509 family)
MHADVMLLRRFGIEISEAEAHTRFVGTTFKAMLDMMTLQFGTVFPEGLDEIKNQIVEELYRSDLKIVVGIADVLKMLKWRNLAVSIGSNSPKKRVELAVELTGIAHHFERIVSFEDVKHGKPAPDIFLRAAELADVPIANCLVVEDSITGVTAATAAGIRTIGFTGTHAHPEQHAIDLKRAGAAVVIAQMEDLIHHL